MYILFYCHWIMRQITKTVNKLKTRINMSLPFSMFIICRLLDVILFSFQDFHTWIIVVSILYLCYNNFLLSCCVYLIVIRLRIALARKDSFLVAVAWCALWLYRLQFRQRLRPDSTQKRPLHCQQIQYVGYTFNILLLLLLLLPSNFPQRRTFGHC